MTTGRIRTIALDYGGTISTSREDHVLPQKGVYPQAGAPAARAGRPGSRLLLASIHSATRVLLWASQPITSGALSAVRSTAEPA